MRELISNAFNGVNIIPTVLLGLVLLYWLVVIIGVIDIDLFDVDIDLDLEAIDGGEGLYAFLTFLNVKEIPFMIVLSIISIIFWIISMLMYLLPIKSGGLINGILLIPALILSILITKPITNATKGIFKKVHDEALSEEEAVIGQLITVISDIKDGRLGQGEIKREGASLRINIKSEFAEDIFIKNEEAYVTKKDEEKNIYYIVKLYKE